MTHCWSDLVICITGQENFSFSFVRSYCKENINQQVLTSYTGLIIDTRHCSLNLPLQSVVISFAELSMLWRIRLLVHLFFFDCGWEGGRRRDYRSPRLLSHRNSVHVRLGRNVIVRRVYPVVHAVRHCFVSSGLAVWRRVFLPVVETAPLPPSGTPSDTPTCTTV